MHRIVAAIMSSVAASFYLTGAMAYYICIIKSYLETEENNEIFAEIINGIPPIIEGAILSHVAYKLTGEVVYEN